MLKWTYIAFIKSLNYRCVLITLDQIQIVLCVSCSFVTHMLRAREQLFPVLTAFVKRDLSLCDTSSFVTHIVKGKVGKWFHNRRSLASSVTVYMRGRKVAS